MRYPQIQIYVDDADEWRWRFKSSNGLKRGEGGQGYVNKSDCIRGLEEVTGGTYTRTYSSRRTRTSRAYQQGRLRRWKVENGQVVAEDIFVQVLS